MAERLKDIVCSWCGAENPDASGRFCQGCGRVIVRLPTWATGRRRRLLTRPRIMWLGTLAALVGLVLWLNYPFFPDPVILLSKRPTTKLSSDSLPDQWSMDGRDIQQSRYVATASHQPVGRKLWSRELGEPTGSAPAVVNGTVYIGGHFKIVALDGETGRTVWEKETTGPVQSSPAVAGGNLYVGFLDHRLVALEREGGKLRWEFKTQDVITASPVVANGMVYIGSWDGFVYALDADTGRLIWKQQTEGPIRSPAAIHDGILFASSNHGILHVLNARTGQSRLRFRTPGPALEPTTVANGLAYFPSGGVLYAVASGAREIPGQYQFKQVWAQFFIWQVPGIPRPPGQQGGRWRFSPEKISKGYASSLAAAPDAIYVGDTRGNFYARHASQGTELWQFRAGGSIVGSPVIVGTRVYFGAKDGFLYALDRASGQMAWRHSLGAPIEVAPVFAGGRLYLRTADGRLHAIE